MTSYKLYFLAERQEIKGRQSSLISLEEPRIKGQTIQFRQTALSTPYYVHIWYYPLDGASGPNQHPLLSSKMDKILACFELMQRQINR